jgi:hypothetical protein
MHRLQWVDSGYAAYMAALQCAQEHARLCEAERARTAELLAPHEAVIATVSKCNCLVSNSYCAVYFILILYMRSVNTTVYTYIILV